MKKKKIIIDGVDVSKCPHINAYFPDSPKCQQGMGVGGCGSECRGKCSYVDKLKIHNEIQQLKKENEEEIEGLKLNLSLFKKSLYSANKENLRLEKENEELKNRLQILDDEILTVEITIKEFETYKKYKQALEKIKELAEKIDDYACEWCDDLHNDFIDASREIQDIISEVLDENS